MFDKLIILFRIAFTPTVFRVSILAMTLLFITVANAKHPTRIVLTGVAASGKSTQGKKLSEYYKVPLFEFTTLLKEEIKQDTKEGREIANIEKENKKVPEYLVRHVVEKALLSENAKNGFILDAQLWKSEHFDNLFKKHKWVVQVIYLYADEQTQIERRGTRFFCATHCTNNPQADTAKGCEKCNKEEIIHANDEARKFLEKIKKEKEEVRSVLDYWKHRLHFLYVDTSNMNSEEVFKKIIAFVDVRQSLEAPKSEKDKLLSNI